MNPDAIITLLVVVAALILFLTEYYPVDLVALSIIVVLVVTGVITPRQGVAGFANSATITVASLFVVTDAILRTGLITHVSPWVARLFKKGYLHTIVGINALVGAISAFINNTPVVATMIPIVSTAARNASHPPGRYLIPLSYGAIFGGTCTLIGTSTNLLVSGIAEDAGLPGFSMFLMTPLGLVFVFIGTIYLTVFGRRLIPEHEGENGFESMEEIHGFEAEVEVTEKPEDGKSTIGNLFDQGKDSKLCALEVRRGDNITKDPPEDFSLEEGDYIHLKGDMDRITDLIKKDFISFSENPEKERFPNEATHLVEIVLLPNSQIIDRRLGEERFLEDYRAHVLAIRSRGEERFSNLEEVKLRPGDILLIQTDETGIRQLKNSGGRESDAFLALRETKVKAINPLKLAIVLGVLVSIIGLASLQVLPIMIAALGGVVVLNLSGVMTMHQSYRAIDWKVIFLIAGALSLGKAMDSSGIADALGKHLVEGIGQAWGPVAIVSALYLATSIFTEVMSNNAAAAVLAPIAISVASAMNIDPTPLLLAIAFAGSASFMTPVGYQTNTMVYSAGSYQFTDFTRVGLPLNLLFWLAATIFIPIFYPLN